MTGARLRALQIKYHRETLDVHVGRTHVLFATVSIIPARVHFEQAGSSLTAVEIVRGTRSPLIGSLHRALVALGIVISSYQARAGASEIMERIVMERRDGGCIEAQLSADTKAAILRIAVDEEAPQSPGVSASSPRAV